MKNPIFYFVALLSMATACKDQPAPEQTFNDLSTGACVCMGNADLERNPQAFQSCLDSVALAGKKVLLAHCFENMSGSDETAMHAAKQVLLDSLARSCALFNEMGFEVPLLPGYAFFGKTLDVSLGTILDSVTVTVTDDAGSAFSIRSNGRGMYAMLLPLKGVVTLTYSKTGYVTKKVLLRFDQLPEEERNVLFESEIDMRLFQLVEGFDTRILDEPIGILAFDTLQLSFAFDIAHTEQVQNAIKAEYDRLGLELHAPVGGEAVDQD